MSVYAHRLGWDTLAPWWWHFHHQEHRSQLFRFCLTFDSLRQLHSNRLRGTGHTLERKIVKTSYVFKQKLWASTQTPFTDTPDVRFIMRLWLHSCALPPHRTLHEIHHQGALLFSSVQSLSPVRLFATPWTAACQASLSITNSRSLLKLMSIESVMPSSHLILCCPLLLPPSIPPSIRVFPNEAALRIRWPKYWSFSFNISLSNEHPGLISFRMDWLYLLAY